MNGDVKGEGEGRGEGGGEGEAETASRPSCASLSWCGDKLMATARNTRTPDGGCARMLAYNPFENTEEGRRGEERRGTESKAE